MQDADTRLDQLGHLEDLPQVYRDALKHQNLVPLWPSLRALLPPHAPVRQTQSVHWAYAALRPLLMQAGELTPIEKAERRVLVLANPGHGLETMKVSPAIYLGMQLLLPGECAPGHRHSPNAARMVIEGEGAHTTVDGEATPMQRGDLILTPTGLWHEHEHTGTGPVIWLDVLDLPIIHYAETSYLIEEGPRQAVRPGHGECTYTRGGVVPSPQFVRSDKGYPLLRYPWVDVRAALLALASDQPKLEAVQVTYVNPETGRDAQNNLGFHALMLRPWLHRCDAAQPPRRPTSVRLHGRRKSPAPQTGRIRKPGLKGPGGLGRMRSRGRTMPSDRKPAGNAASFFRFRPSVPA